LIKIEKKPILKFDYTYWSSPVANQSLFNTSPETLSNKFFSFNPNTNSWLTEVSSKTMVTAKGYIIRGPENFSATTRATYEASFRGFPITAKRRYFLDLHQVLI
jgi:hypothetical protein